MPGYGKRKRYGGGSYGSKRSRNNMGGSGYKATRYRSGGGGGFRTGGFKGTEVKFFDAGVGESVIAVDTAAGTLINPPDINCLFAPTAGTAPNERIGRAVVMKRITIKGTIILNELQLASGTTASGFKVRVMVVQDTQTNHAPPNTNVVSQGVLTDQQHNGGISGANITNAFIDLENIRRFRVLADRTFTFNPSNTQFGQVASTVNNACRSFIIDKRVNIPVMMQADGASVSGIQDNSISMYVMSSNEETGGQDNGQTADIRYLTRVRYTDS